MKKRLLIVDALNIFLRNWFVNPTINADGDPVGAIVGTFGTLQRMCRQFTPDEIIFVWDGQGGSKRRKQMQPDYKAGRKPLRNNHDVGMDEEEAVKNRIHQQLVLTELLNATPVIQLMVDSVEADDVIAYLCQGTRYEDFDKYVVSSDADMVQLLLADGTFLVRPNTKIVTNEFGEKQRLDEVLDRASATEKYSIPPQNFALAKAVVGDKGDNVIGVEGIGFKTLVKRFPMISEERDVFSSELVQHAQEQVANKKKPIKAYVKVSTAQQMIDANYQMVQLYSPLMNYHQKQEVEEVLNTDERKMRKWGFLACVKKNKIDWIHDELKAYLEDM